MSEQRKVPKLRFPEFTDDWEQREFTELVTIERGGSPRPIDQFITDDVNGLNWIKIGDAPLHGNYITSTKEKIKPEGLSKTREVFPGDLILSNSMSFGRPYIMGIKGCIHDGWLAIKDPNKHFDLFFLCILLGSDVMLQQYKSLAAGSTVNNLNKELVGKTTVSYPSKAEQQKIGACLWKLDNLITLHQRKCEVLKKLKKGLLQKMFPKDGTNIPEIRFPEFSDAWEQRKCGDVMSESRISGHFGDIAKKITVKLWGKGVFKKSDVGSSNTQYFIRKEGQFIYSKLDFLNSAFGVIPKELDSYETTTDLPAFDCNGINPYFMFYRAIQPNFYYENGVIADGSRKAKRIHADVFLNMPLKLPTIEEQNKIVSFLLQLDNLITLHQRKLEVLKKLKKGLLQQMFV